MKSIVGLLMCLCLSTASANMKNDTNKVEQPMSYKNYIHFPKILPLIDNRRSNIIHFDNLIQSTIAKVSDGNDYRRTYIYNEKKRIIQTLEEKMNNGVWIVESRESKKYDENDNTLSIIKENYSNGNWIYDTRFIFDYDNKNRTICVKKQKWVDSSWVLLNVGSQTFNDNNDLVRSESEEWSKGVRTSRFTYDYSYDTNHNILSWIYNEQRANNSIKSYRYYYSYNENGQLIGERKESLLDGSCYNDMNIYYKYDDNGFLCEYGRGRWKNGDWYYGGRWTYEHDEQGNPVIMNRESLVDGKWVLQQQKRNIQYDSFGNIIHEETAEMDNGILKPNLIISNNYFSDGSLQSSTKQKCDTDEIINQERTTKNYNEIGNPLVIIGEKWTNGNISSDSRKTEYSYSDDGSFVSVIVYGNNSGEWEKKNLGVFFSDDFGNSFAHYNCSELNIIYYSDNNVNEFANNIKFELTPNPALQIIDVSFSESPNNITCKIEVFDSNGRLCLVYPVTGPTGNQIDISGLSPGAYIVKCNGTSKGFIKQ